MLHLLGYKISKYTLNPVAMLRAQLYPVDQVRDSALRHDDSED
ncbi:MAG: hypothetical protein ACNA7Q_03505 [Rhodobacterales bacterium]